MVVWAKKPSRRSSLRAFFMRVEKKLVMECWLRPNRFEIKILFVIKLSIYYQSVQRHMVINRLGG